MARETWTILNGEEGIYEEEFTLTPADLPGALEGWWVKKRTLRGGLQDGVDLIEVYNGRFGVAILPTRGMGIWRCWKGNRTLGWQSPVRGPVHPKFVPLAEPSGLGWLDGFDELLVRCGLESNGAPEFDAEGRLRYPLHGRIANRPAHRVEVTVDSETGEIAVTGEVEESRFHFTKLRLRSTVSLRPNELGFAVHDEVENFGGAPCTMQLLYHLNIGQPTHQPGARLVAPVKVVAPRDLASAQENWPDYGPEAPGGGESAFFFELLGDTAGESHVLLKNAKGDEGISVGFNVGQLPYFTQWKNPAAAADGYVTGLEPATNFPNPRSYETEQGRVVTLPPGGTQAFGLRLDWRTKANEVQAAEQAIAALQQAAAPRVHTAPLPGWSPSA